MARVAIITQYFPPDPPSWIAAGLADELAARGHSVRVLTTFPHYETGRVAHGYKQSLRHVDKHGAVTVRRVPLIASHSTNPIGRIANYVSVATSMRFARRFIRDADVAYVYATPMTVADPARVWSRSLGIPYVVHVQDMWPESVTGSGILPGVVLRPVERMLNAWLGRVYRAASAVIAIAPTMRRVLVERGVPEERAHTVFNWSNDADSSEPRISDRAEAGLRLVYAGNLGRMQDVETILRALAELRDVEGLTVKIAGFGVIETELRELAESLGLANVEFVGKLSADDVAKLYDDSDFQFVTLRDLEIFDGTIPSKFQAGIANGLPAISTVRGDLRGVIDDNGLGFTAAPEDVTDLARAIREAYATPGNVRAEMRVRARKYYAENMSRSAAVDQIEKLMLEAIDERATGGRK